MPLSYIYFILDNSPRLDNSGLAKNYPPQGE